MEREATEIADHYEMDKSCGWMFWRSYFEWNTVRKPKIKSLQIIMEQRKISIPGVHFHVSQPGDRVSFRHPGTGEQYILTVQEYEKREMDMTQMFSQDWEYPAYYHEISYTVEPAMENGVMTVTDCGTGDRPKQKIQDMYAPAAMASIGIIGGADGPTTVYIAGKSTQNVAVACSALYFEPVEDVEWGMVFHEKQYENKKIELVMV